MKKVERLELENQVLKNTIGRVLEIIEIGTRTGEMNTIEGMWQTIGAIQNALEYEDRIKCSLENEVALDYRYSSRTIRECEERYRLYEAGVILNDGMVMGFEY